MTFDEAQILAHQRLRAQGHLLHSQLLQITGGDESMMCTIRDRLIEHGLVVDKYGVALVAVEAAVTSPQDIAATSKGKADKKLPIGRGVSAATTGEGTSPRVAHPLRQTSQQSSAGGAIRYFLWNAGRESGPFARDELEQRVADGRLQPTDFVRIDSDDEWTPASKALSRTVPSQVVAPEQKPSTRAPSTRTQTPAEELAAATTLAVAVAAAARQAAQSHSQRHSVPDSRPVPGEGMWLPPAVWNWLKQHCGKGQIQMGTAVLMFALCILIFLNWPASAKTTYDEFLQYRVLLEGLEAQGAKPSSPEWKKFVAKHRPRIEKLVDSLKPRANPKYPANQELLRAGERGLLAMLEEGVQGRPLMKFNEHMHNVRQILDGAPPANPASVGTFTQSSTPSSVLAEPAIPPGAPAATGTTNPAIPARAHMAIPVAPLGTANSHASTPPGAPKPTR